MRIGIDVSQTAFPNTGVANYLEELVRHLCSLNPEHEYILFFSSLRKRFQPNDFHFATLPHNITVKEYKFPPSLLDFMWNKLHIYPIEWFVGDIDVFITSDWTEPPAKKAKKLSILYDLIIYTYPEETDKRIVETQKRKLAWAIRESAGFLCISNSTKQDAVHILGIPEEKLFVIRPGI